MTTERTIDPIASAIDRHAEQCSFKADKVSDRLRTLEIRFATLIGLMLGAGFIGGSVSGALIKLL